MFFTFLAWNSFCGIKVIETIRRQHSNSPSLFMYSSGFIQFATLNGTSLSSASLTLHRYCGLCIFPAKVDIVIPRMNSKRKHFIVQMNIVALYDERVPFSQWKCDWICLKGNWMKLLCGIIIIYIVLIIWLRNTYKKTNHSNLSFVEDSHRYIVGCFLF